MASEIRVNTINNRSGLGTISLTNSGAVFSGVTTFAQIKTTSGEVTVGTGASVFSPATNVLALGTNNTEKVRISSTGSVGIGTDNPGQKLQVQDGHIDVTNGSGHSYSFSYGKFTAERSAAQTTSEVFQGGYTGNTGTSKIYADGKAYFLNDVGIGTDNPVGSLEVRDSKANLIVAKDGLTVKSNSDLHTSYDTLQIGAGGALLSYSTATVTADTQFVHNAYRSSGGTFKYRYADTAARIRMNSPGGEIIFDNAASGSADADITFSERLRITSGGNIGIGTNVPDASLHIHNNTAASFDAICLSGYPKRQNLIRVNGADNLIVSVDEDNEGNDSNFRLQIDGSEKLRITSSGNIGAGGITTPTFTTGGGIHLGDAYGIGFGNGDNGRPDFQIVYDTGQNNGLQIRCGNGADTADVYFTTAGNLAFASGKGIDFSATANSSGTMSSELLDDYEEGTFTMTMSCGGNTASQECRYTKIGRIVYIDGHGTEINNNYFNTQSQSTNTAATITTNLPFTPVRTGAASITVSRTLKGANGFQYERMYVGWRKNSATIYLGSESNNYYPVDNVVTHSTQTNKTILFSGHFVTEV